MVLLACAGIGLLSFGIYYVLGKAVALRYHWSLAWTELICMGFFLYYALFQVIAELMIFSKQKLHVLGRTWLGILVLWLLVSFSIFRQEKKKMSPKSPSVVRVRPGKTVRWVLLVMVAAVVCECAAAVLMQRNIGWDFAYYIGNMTTSVQTDTMYLFDGSSGKLRDTMELRYALSGFYMNTAWISQMTGIHALLLQKYFVGVQCVILSSCVLYSFAMEAFLGDQKKAGVLVILSILLTSFWDVYDTSAQFLMLRSYEAKAYCANVVMPMIIYLLYRLWKDVDRQENWAKLFIVAFASVAVSMSSILLVPAAIVIMMLAHLAATKRLQWAILRRTIYCLLPNACYLLVYFAGTMGWLVVEV